MSSSTPKPPATATKPRRSTSRRSSATSAKRARPVSARSAAISALSDVDNGVASLDAFDKILTAKQRDFLFALEALVDEGKPVSYADVAKVLHITRQTLYNWRRDALFNRVAARIVASHADLQVELVHRAAMRRALLGSPIHYELILRRLGLYQPTNGEAGEGSPLNGLQQVVFVGLPQAPTPEDARRILPPIGSTIIVPAPAQATEGAR